MLYGDGGAGKPTLTADLAFHLASGTDWLGMCVPKAVRVLLVESEGPRALFRQKLMRKLESWSGAAVAGDLMVWEEPWGELTFAAEDWQGKLARIVREQEIDVLIAGPLTRLGMDAAGTLQEVRAFMDQVNTVRRQSERRLTVILVHHENKGGSVSGAWEGAGDTLLHVEAAGNGHTVVRIQKARWDSTRHATTLKLAWTDGQGFRVEGDRDYLGAITELMSDGTWRTVEQIREGIGAGKATVERIVKEDHEDCFQMRTGEDAKALGRDSKARLYQLAEMSGPTPESRRVQMDLPGVREAGLDSGLPLRSPEESSPDTPRDWIRTEPASPDQPGSGATERQQDGGAA